MLPGYFVYSIFWVSSKIKVMCLCVSVCNVLCVSELLITVQLVLLWLVLLHSKWSAITVSYAHNSYSVDAVSSISVTDWLHVVCVLIYWCYWLNTYWLYSEILVLHIDHMSTVCWNISVRDWLHVDCVLKCYFLLLQWTLLKQEECAMLVSTLKWPFLG